MRSDRMHSYATNETELLMCCMDVIAPTMATKSKQLVNMTHYNVGYADIYREYHNMLVCL